MAEKNKKTIDLKTLLSKKSKLGLGITIIM